MFTDQASVGNPSSSEWSSIPYSGYRILSMCLHNRKALGSTRDQLSYLDEKCSPISVQCSLIKHTHVHAQSEGIGNQARLGILSLVSSVYWLHWLPRLSDVYWKVFVNVYAIFDAFHFVSISMKLFCFVFHLVIKAINTKILTRQLLTVNLKKIYNGELIPIILQKFTSVDARLPKYFSWLVLSSTYHMALSR